MSHTIDLICLSEQNTIPPWPCGKVFSSPAIPQLLHQTLNKVTENSTSDFILIWDKSLGNPDPECMQKISNLPGNLWHAGLKLGMSDQPTTIDFIWPNWMFTKDADAVIESTSWRISLRACLIQRDVLVQMGNIQPKFKTLEGAGLEMGHHFISRGVFTRYIPWMISHSAKQNQSRINFEDALRFVFCRTTKFWLLWTIFRIVITGRYPRFRSLYVFLFLLKGQTAQIKSKPYIQKQHQRELPHSPQDVSIIIPTIDRYPYLEKLLSQIRSSTIKPVDIVVIDQTSIENRQPELYNKFKDLPLKIIFQEQPGQCTSRNEGIKQCIGQYILFLDDDVEISPTLLAEHFKIINQYRADVSCGVFDEKGRGALPEHFTFSRTSDVFPAGNSLVKKSILSDSGLFDLAYNHSSRADGDLGMRIYLKGKFMILNPKNSVFHHHAPSGGLRNTRARVTTFASSRKNIFHRNLPSISEIYLAMRFFTKEQLAEVFWQCAFGSFQIKGAVYKKIIKFFISGIALPHTIWKLHKNKKTAEKWLKLFPKIEFPI